jgi:hypothetical protein
MQIDAGQDSNKNRVDKLLIHLNRRPRKLWDSKLQLMDYTPVLRRAIESTRDFRHNEQSPRLAQRRKRYLQR